MQTTYTYKVLNVDLAARTMEVKYDSVDYGSMNVYTRVPYENETLESVIQQYSPLAYWREKSVVVQNVVADTAFGTIVYSDDPTVSDIANQARDVRNQLLALSDYTQLADVPATLDKVAWQNYRQELRDVTSQVGFPTNIVWPISPA